MKWMTDWYLGSSSGTMANVNLKFVTVGAGLLSIHVSNKTTKENRELLCGGLDLGIGVSWNLLKLPVGLDTSVGLPSTGSHVVDLRPDRRTPFEASDFAGWAIIYSGGIKGMGGGSGSLVIFCSLPPIGGVPGPMKAAGCLAGMVGGTTLGLGLDTYVCHVTLADPPLPEVAPRQRPATAIPIGGDYYLVPNNVDEVFGR